MFILGYYQNCGNFCFCESSEKKKTRGKVEGGGFTWDTTDKTGRENAKYVDLSVWKAGLSIYWRLLEIYLGTSNLI